MRYICLICTLIMLSSCNSCSPSEKINKGGEIVGNGVGEFVQGMSSGAQNSFEVNCILNKKLSSKGISKGKTVLSSDTVGTDNLLSVYLIFSQSFNGTLTAKAFDGKNNEMGRAAVTINAASGSASWHDFIFDKRTNIDYDSRIELE